MKIDYTQADRLKRAVSKTKIELDTKVKGEGKIGTVVGIDKFGGYHVKFKNELVLRFPISRLQIQEEE